LRQFYIQHEVQQNTACTKDRPQEYNNIKYRTGCRFLLGIYVTFVREIYSVILRALTYTVIEFYYLFTQSKLFSRKKL